MSTWNALERAVLQELCGMAGPAGPALAAQLSVARITDRENSGKGFFVSLDVPRQAAPSVTCESPVGATWALIEGFEHPMLFLLFLRDGYASMLEGATVGDETRGVDFAARSYEFFVTDWKLHGRVG